MFGLSLIEGLVVMLFLAGIAIYFMPIAIALSRGHLQCKAIFVLNLFAGWTFIGWLVGLYGPSCRHQPASPHDH